MRSQKARLPPPGAGIAQTSTLGSASIIPAKTLKPEPRKVSVTSLILDRVAQVGLVDAVPAHRIGVGDALEGRRRHCAAAAEFLEHARQHRLDRGEHIVLGDEAHLEIELIEFAGAAVGAAVFVAEAGRDLEIAVEAGDHQQLLELLRRLGQRIEVAGMDAAGHQIVARALGARGGQDRGLELGEALVDHPPAQGGDHARAQHDIAVHLVAPQIEVAIAQPHILGIVLVAEHLQRQRVRRRLHRDLGDLDLDLAGRQLGVRGLRAAAHHPAGHA